MQNSNNPNVSRMAANRIHSSRLEARSLSPNMQAMHELNEFYPNDVSMSQYYHSMPHVCENLKKEVLLTKLNGDSNEFFVCLSHRKFP